VHCDKAFMVWDFFLSFLKIRWSFPCHFCELISDGLLQTWRVHLLSFGSPCRGPFVGVCGKKETTKSLITRLGARRSCFCLSIKLFLIGFRFGWSLWMVIRFLYGVRSCNLFLSLLFFGFWAVVPGVSLAR